MENTSSEQLICLIFELFSGGESDFELLPSLVLRHRKNFLILGIFVPSEGRNGVVIHRRDGLIRDYREGMLLNYFGEGGIHNS